MSTMGGGWGVEDRFIAAFDCTVDVDVEDEVTGFIIRRGLEGFEAAVICSSGCASSSLLGDSLSCSTVAFVALDRRLLRREAAALAAPPAAPRILNSAGGVETSFVLVRRERELWFVRVSTGEAIMIRVHRARWAEP